MLFNRPVDQLVQLIQSALGMLIVLGIVHLTSEQLGAVMVFVGTFLAYSSKTTLNQALATGERAVAAKNEEIKAVESANQSSAGGTP